MFNTPQGFIYRHAAFSIDHPKLAKFILGSIRITAVYWMTKVWLIQGYLIYKVATISWF